MDLRSLFPLACPGPMSRGLDSLGRPPWTVKAWPGVGREAGPARPWTPDRIKDRPEGRRYRARAPCLPGSAVRLLNSSPGQYLPVDASRLRPMGDLCSPLVRGDPRQSRGDHPRTDERLRFSSTSAALASGNDRRTKLALALDLPCGEEQAMAFVRQLQDNRTDRAIRPCPYHCNRVATAE